jgi:4-hydroxybenzoate polyprenyltransferase
MSVREVGADWCEAVRLELAPLAALPFALGAAVTLRMSVLDLVGLAVAGACLHSATALVNELADRPSDALHPRRSNRAVLTGRITPADAIVACFVFLAVFLSILFRVDSTGFLVLALVPVAAIQVYGNAYQKRSKVVPPPVMDFLFGATMGFPIVAVPWTAGAPVAGSTILLAATLVLDMAALNIMVGNTKDLPWDERAGDRTTALILGVRAIMSGRMTLHLTRRYQGYCALLLVTRWFVLAAALATANPRPDVLGSTLIIGLSGAGAVARLASTRGLIVRPGTRLPYVFVVTNLVTFLGATALVEPARAVRWVVAGTIVWSLLVHVALVLVRQASDEESGRDRGAVVTGSD